MTDEIKVTIAAQACLLVLAMDHNYFDRVPCILVYPHGYRAPPPEDAPSGVIIDTRDGRLGEAHYRGPGILSWSDVLHQGPHPSRRRNLVVHKFSPQLA